MPRPASPRKGSPVRPARGPSIKSSAKKAAARAAKPASKPNGGAGRAIAKPSARAVRSGLERRASEKIVHAGRTVPGADTLGSTSRGKYVYCIIESSDALRFGPIGIGADPSDVYTVHYKNLAAVVSDAPLEVLDSTRENVL